MSGSTVSRLTQIGATVRILLHLLRGVFYVGVALPHLRRAERDGLISRWSYVGLQILNIRMHVQGDIPPQNATSILFVANHVSWVDILALSAFRRVRFVAKAEVRRWPIIGWLAVRTGTLFIQRNRPRQLSRLVRSMNRALERGDCLAIFPEGTTTDGGGVLPFHSGPLEAAVTSGALVWPVAFRYSTPEGHRSESVAFVGNQSLIQSIIRVASQPSIHLRLHFTTPFEAHERTRQVVAQKARSAILTHIDDVYPSLLAHEVDAESSG